MGILQALEVGTVRNAVLLRRILAMKWLDDLLWILGLVRRERYIEKRALAMCTTVFRDSNERLSLACKLHIEEIKRLEAEKAELHAIRSAASRKGWITRRSA
jgi:hypothetical protein